MTWTDLYIKPESDKMDFWAMGNLILDRAISLSIAVNKELLSPISHWIDDPGFMEKYETTMDKDKPNWARYKKKQRQWTKRNKTLAAERLRRYWREISRRKNLRKELSKLFQKNRKKVNPKIPLEQGCIAEIIKPFSPSETAKRETKRAFREARSRSPSCILPWETILLNDIREFGTFGHLKQYHDEFKIDKVAKLLHLLQMESDGTVTLNQLNPFGEIQIEPDECYPVKGSFSIKDKYGQKYQFEWPDLSDAQKDRVIADLINNEIILTA